MSMKIVKLKLSELEGNIGQIPELPMNPRNWNKDEVDALAASLKETPELFEARPIIVVPYGEKYVILGGNMRFEASKQNEAKDVPCIVFPADTPIAKMKEIVIKDNGSFGTWDLAALKSEWGDLPLPDWGAPKLPDMNFIDGIPTDLDADPKNAPFICKLTFTDGEQMTIFIDKYMRILQDEFPGITISDTGGEL